MRFWVCLSLLALSSCASAESKTYQYYLANRGMAAPAGETFQHCRGYGCKIIEEISFAEKEWKKIGRLFKPASKDATQERARVEKAIGLMEQIAGPITGTEGDVRGTFIKIGDFQLDCVDESTNSTVYLLLLKEKGYLKFHEVEAPSVRLPIFGGGAWTHQTAVMREIESGVRYAVDSWFHDNGAPAHVVALRDWTYGWRPSLPPIPPRKPPMES